MKGDVLEYHQTAWAPVKNNLIALGAASGEAPKCPFEHQAEVKVCSDRYGLRLIGKIGNVEGMVGDLVKVSMSTCSTFKVHADALCLLKDLSAPRPWKTLNQLTLAVREDWLLQAQFNQHAAGEDTFEGFVQHLHGVEFCSVSSLHLRFWGNYLRWGLEVFDADCSIVDGELFVLWSKAQADAVVGEGCMKLREQEVIRICRGSKRILVPIWSGVGSPHWTLLAIDRDVKAVRYYDSLLKPKETNQVQANVFLELLKKQAPEYFPWFLAAVLERCNASTQGAEQCGFFVCWWMEEEMRQQLGEGWCSRGRIRALDLRRQLERMLINLKPAAKRMLQLAEKASEPEEPKVAEAPPAEHSALSALADHAAADLSAGDPDAGMPLPVEDDDLEAWAEHVMYLLLPAHRADVERVKAKGTRVCSKCCWSSGCYSCWWPKTCRYWRNKEAK